MFTGDVYFDVMSHLAMWEGPDPASGEPETTWGEHVTDAEYHYPQGSGHGNH